MNIQDWFPLGLTGGSPCCPRDSQESSPTPQLESINSSALSFLYSPTLTSIHDYWKNQSFDCTDLVGKVMSLLFNMLSSLVIDFLPRSKCLLFYGTITVFSDFGAPQNKVSHSFHSFPIYMPWSDGTGCYDLTFWMLSSFFFYLLTYLLAVLGLCCCVGFYSSCGAQASLAAGHGPWSTGLTPVEHRLSCSAACGLFQEHELNPCLPHQQVDSLPLSHWMLSFKPDFSLSFHTHQEAL